MKKLIALMLLLPLLMMFSIFTSASTVVLNSLDMTIEEYYERHNTNFEKECAKTDNDCGEWTEEAIAVPAYILTLNGKEYDFTKPVTEDITLKAKWKIQKILE